MPSDEQRMCGWMPMLGQPAWLWKWKMPWSAFVGVSSSIFSWISTLDQIGFYQTARRSTEMKSFENVARRLGNSAVNWRNSWMRSRTLAMSLSAEVSPNSAPPWSNFWHTVHILRENIGRLWRKPSKRRSSWKTSLLRAWAISRKRRQNWHISSGTLKMFVDQLEMLKSVEYFDHCFCLMLMKQIEELLTSPDLSPVAFLKSIGEHTLKRVLRPWIQADLVLEAPTRELQDFDKNQPIQVDWDEGRLDGNQFWHQRFSIGRSWASDHQSESRPFRQTCRLNQRLRHAWLT